MAGQSWTGLVARWRAAALAIDVAAFWDLHLEAGIGVASHGRPAYPRCLVDDPEPPAVLFHRGDPDVIAGKRVAVVGTRRCSARGAAIARRMGFELSRAGVGVVSGLALGIDGAAHAGALEAAARGGAPPIGVVASGLDVVYPKRHRRLWTDVAAAGVLLTECPLTVQPTRWRFPARNRILAGLADLVVVVESPSHGGSMHTVEEAQRRGIEVLAVPGAVGVRAAEGTNKLIFDGAGMARDTDDVLVALGLGAGAAGIGPVADPRPPPSAVANAILAAMAWQPCTFAEVVERTAMAPVEVAEGVAELRSSGWIEAAGAWLERVAR